MASGIRSTGTPLSLLYTSHKDFFFPWILVNNAYSWPILQLITNCLLLNSQKAFRFGIYHVTLRNNNSEQIIYKIILSRILTFICIFSSTHLPFGSWLLGQFNMTSQRDCCVFLSGKWSNVFELGICLTL